MARGGFPRLAPHWKDSAACPCSVSECPTAGQFQERALPAGSCLVSVWGTFLSPPAPPTFSLVFGVTSSEAGAVS